ncbi:MAG: TolC family protein [Phycisphaerae bacterium]|nr:TolC family protein [Phycisphaerae bacterium]
MFNVRFHATRASRRLPMFIALFAGACQSYQARPLDLPAHEKAFLARPHLSPDAPFDLADGVTLSEAEAVAIVFNADLRIARLRAGVTLAGAENAGLWEDPVIGVDLTRILASVADPWKLAATVGFTIPVSGRLDIEKAKAKHEHVTELLRVEQREWQARINLRRAWARWSMLSAQAAATREFVDRSGQVLGIVDMMESAGEIPRTEARLFRIEKATTQSSLLLFEAQLASSTLAIKQLMGLAPAAPVELLPTTFEVPTGDLDAASRVMQSPAMRVAIAEYEVAEQSLQLEVRKQYPDLNLSPGYEREDGNDQVLLGISVPLPILNANRRGIAEANALRELSRAVAETVLEQLIGDLAEAAVQRDAAAEQRIFLESEIIPLVDAEYADAREIARLGEVNTLVLLESLVRQQDAQVRLIDARLAEVLATIRFEELLGPPIPAGDEGGAP